MDAHDLIPVLDSHGQGLAEFTRKAIRSFLVARTWAGQLSTLIRVKVDLANVQPDTHNGEVAQNMQRWRIWPEVDRRRK
jgi:hypothetical protein